MDLGISGKCALVCGSSSGLGLACATELARAGCDVFVNGRNIETLASIAQKLRESTGAKITPVAADIGTRDGRETVFQACPSADIVITNNAGPPPSEFLDLDDVTIQRGIEQNMLTPLAIVRHYLPGMCDRGFGRIVNITSLSVLMPLQGLDLSSGARAGLMAFLAGPARRYAAKNVTVNNLLPGKIETERLKNVVAANALASEREFSSERTRQMQEIPARRFGTPEEFGYACAFLCGQRAGYITGQNLVLDGGLFQSAF